MKNILFDNRWNGSHGIGRFSREILERLSKNYQVSLFSIYNLDSFKSFPAVITTSQNDLFLSPSFVPPILCRLPFIFTIHDLIHLNFAAEMTIGKSIYYQTIVKRGPIRCAKVLTVSHFSKSEIVKKFSVNPDKIVVGNGVSDYFCTNDFRFRYDKPYFIYVGNSKPHKNLLGTLIAFKNFNLNKDFSLFCISGINKKIREYIEINELQENVFFMYGITDQQLASLYRGSVALLFPSFYEGFGLPVLEAMACGTPVITSNITSLPEIAGDAALLVNPYSLDEIVSAMNKIVEDDSLRHQMIEKGLKQSKNFSWDLTLKKIMNVIESIII